MQREHFATIQATWTAKSVRVTTATLTLNVREQNVTSAAALIAFLSQPLQLLLTVNRHVTLESIVSIIND